MGRLRSWLAPPPPQAGPGETLRWVRRGELLIGLVALGFGIAWWSAGWWHWGLIAIGLVCLSPWGGGARALRRAQRNPSMAITDPGRRRARARRTVLILVPFYILGGGAIGYARGGWGDALHVAAVIAISAGLTSAWILWRYR